MSAPHSLSALLLSIVIAGSAVAATPRVTRLPAATLLELAAAAAPDPLPRENRHDKRPRRGLTTVASLGAVDVLPIAKPRITAAATIAAPPVSAGFAADSSRRLSPADSSGAAGRTHVVAASNAGIVVQTRAGALLSKLSLVQFWRGTGGADIYDPRLAYDAVADRWVTVAIREESAVLVAASATGDPTGVWFRYELEVPDCDFTRLALTRDTVMIATIVGFDSPGASLFALSKQSLYAGTGSITLVEYTIGADVVPVESPDSEARYVVFASFGKFFFKRLDGATSSWQSVDSGFNWYSWERQGPQSGTSAELDIGYMDVESAVYRGGSLFAVHRLGATSRTGDDNALLWWKVNPSATTPPELGIIDDPSPGTIYSYPSLAVNNSGAMLISWCTMSPTTFPSASYLYRDAGGHISTTATLRNGDSRIVDTNRWGDYTTTVVDPLNDRDFWTVQIYARDNAWQTWWAQVKPPRGKSRAVRR